MTIKNFGVTALNCDDIRRLIPHRYPFVFVDRVEDIQWGQSAVGIKNVTISEPFFPGHFPDNPIMPGVIMIEAMAQTAGILVVASLEREAPLQEKAGVSFMSIQQARFRQPVRPGDCLAMRVERQHHRGSVWRFAGKAYVKDVLVAEAVFTAMIQRDERVS